MHLVFIDLCNPIWKHFQRLRRDRWSLQREAQLDWQRSM